MVMMLTYENEGMHLVPMIILERKEEVSGCLRGMLARI